MTKYPPLTIFDETEKPTGEASLEDIHAKGLRHRVVIVVVYDSNGRLLLQRRSKMVVTNPGKWDVSAAGHVDSGEDYSNAARRELFEETGLSGLELKEIAHYYTESVTDGRILNRFIKIYKTTVSPDTKFVIDHNELSEVKWFSNAELKLLLGKHPEKFNHDFSEVLSKIGHTNENNQH